MTLGKKENQKFVQLSYTRFKTILQDLCDWHGIAYVTQEESYASQASFLDQDSIPVYGCKNTEPVFSGKRSPTKYGVQIKKDGFRGLYRTKDGSIINADLNGSANIGRKAFPEQFTPKKVNFSNPLICRHPDNGFFQSVTASM